MNFKALDEKMKSLFQKERELLSEVLEHIQLCDQRKLFLEFGYANLFVYLTKHIGYSEGAAQRRIDAARLIKEIPEVKEKLESGKISLSHISMVQRASRKTGKNIKAKAISALEKKSHQEAEKIVADLFDLPVQSETKSIHQKDESVRLKITLSKEQFEKLQKVKDQLSHLIPDGNLPEVLEYMMTQMLTATVAVEVKTNKTLTPKTRKFVLQRDKCCQFVSPQTGKQCGSTWQLQVDHIQPRWAEGSNDPRNLRVLCGQHNRYRYQRENKFTF